MRKYMEPGESRYQAGLWRTFLSRVAVLPSSGNVSWCKCRESADKLCFRGMYSHLNYHRNVKQIEVRRGSWENTTLRVYIFSFLFAVDDFHQVKLKVGTLWLHNGVVVGRGDSFLYVTIVPLIWYRAYTLLDRHFILLSQPLFSLDWTL